MCRALLIDELLFLGGVKAMENTRFCPRFFEQLLQTISCEYLVSALTSLRETGEESQFCAGTLNLPLVLQAAVLALPLTQRAFVS